MPQQTNLDPEIKELLELNVDGILKKARRNNAAKKAPKTKVSDNSPALYKIDNKSKGKSKGTYVLNFNITPKRTGETDDEYEARLIAAVYVIKQVKMIAGTGKQKRRIKAIFLQGCPPYSDKSKVKVNFYKKLEEIFGDNAQSKHNKKGNFSIFDGVVFTKVKTESAKSKKEKVLTTIVEYNGQEVVFSNVDLEDDSQAVTKELARTTGYLKKSKKPKKVVVVGSGIDSDGLKHVSEDGGIVFNDAAANFMTVEEKSKSKFKSSSSPSSDSADEGSDLSDDEEEKENIKKKKAEMDDDDMDDTEEEVDNEKEESAPAKLKKEKVPDGLDNADTIVAKIVRSATNFGKLDPEKNYKSQKISNVQLAKYYCGEISYEKFCESVFGVDEGTLGLQFTDEHQAYHDKSYVDAIDAIDNGDDDAISLQDNFNFIKLLFPTIEKNEDGLGMKPPYFQDEAAEKTWGEFLENNKEQPFVQAIYDNFEVAAEGLVAYIKDRKDSKELKNKDIVLTLYLIGSLGAFKHPNREKIVNNLYNAIYSNISLKAVAMLNDYADRAGITNFCEFIRNNVDKYQDIEYINIEQWEENYKGDREGYTLANFGNDCIAKAKEEKGKKKVKKKVDDLGDDTDSDDSDTPSESSKLSDSELGDLDPEMLKKIEEDMAAGLDDEELDDGGDEEEKDGAKGASAKIEDGVELNNTIVAQIIVVSEKSKKPSCHDVTAIQLARYYCGEISYKDLCDQVVPASEKPYSSSSDQKKYLAKKYNQTLDSIGKDLDGKGINPENNHRYIQIVFPSSEESKHIGTDAYPLFGDDNTNWKDFLDTHRKKKAVFTTAIDNNFELGVNKFIANLEQVAETQSGKIKGTYVTKKDKVKKKTIVLKEGYNHNYARITRVIKSLGLSNHPRKVELVHRLNTAIAQHVDLSTIPAKTVAIWNSTSDEALVPRLSVSLEVLRKRKMTAAKDLNASFLEELNKLTLDDEGEYQGKKVLIGKLDSFKKKGKKKEAKEAEVGSDALKMTAKVYGVIGKTKGGESLSKADRDTRKKFIIVDPADTSFGNKAGSKGQMIGATASGAIYDLIGKYNLPSVSVKYVASLSKKKDKRLPNPMAPGRAIWNDTYKENGNKGSFPVAGVIHTVGPHGGSKANKIFYDCFKNILKVFYENTKDLEEDIPGLRIPLISTGYFGIKFDAAYCKMFNQVFRKAYKDVLEELGIEEINFGEGIEVCCYGKEQSKLMSAALSGKAIDDSDRDSDDTDRDSDDPEAKGMTYVLGKRNTLSRACFAVANGYLGGDKDFRERMAVIEYSTGESFDHDSIKLQIKKAQKFIQNHCKEINHKTSKYKFTSKKYRSPKEGGFIGIISDQENVKRVKNGGINTVLIKLTGRGVLDNSPAAKMGLEAGDIIRVVIPSGTKDHEKYAFDYMRNNGIKKGDEAITVYNEGGHKKTLSRSIIPAKFDKSPKGVYQLSDFGLGMSKIPSSSPAFKKSSHFLSGKDASHVHPDGGSSGRSGLL